MSTKPALSDAKRQLLERMMRGEGRDQAVPVPQVGPRPADAVIPLSADQRQIWLHASMAPEAPLYNESITIHRFGSFDLAAMKRAVNEILRRHESWRTGFEMVDGELVQIVHPHRPLDIPVSDVSDLPEAERDTAALAIGSDDARKAIDLADAPLFRARVVKLAEDDHRLYFTLHHIIFDGVSIYRVIVPELAALYEAFAAGKPSPLPEPVLQYGDYSVWQRDYLESAAVRRQFGHWREALAGAPTKLELAGDHARPAHRTHAGSMEVFTLSLELTEALKALSREEGVTLYMTLLAAFKAMLHRYSGEQDIVVGGVTDLRRRPELEQLVGYFLNTMALRSKPSGDLPFRGYLGQVRDTVLGALGASEVPFDMVVREAKIRAEPGAHPLFNILFSIEPPVDPFPDGWDLTQMDIVVGAAKFDLYLELDERPDGMIGRFLYSTEIFEPATIRRMIGHWLTILEHVIVDRACTLADLPLLTADESERMLTGWNDTARALPAESLPQAIAAQARAKPDAVALITGEQSWSYADLDRETGRIAARLHAAGVKPGSLVGVLMKRSSQTIAGLLAILRLGAAYLPLDPGFPAARLEHIVADAAPDTLLTEPALADMLSPRDCRLVLAEGPADGEVPPVAVIDGDDLAYVLYTSGSTGKPKGVEISHRALMNLLVAMGDHPGFGADDSLLAVTTLSFDIAMLEIFLPLLRGGRLILASRDDALDPDRLMALMASSKPTVMQATPATWRALLEGGWSGDRDLKILCGGEALSRDLADQLLARSGELWNMYGPTETTIWSTVQKVAKGSGPVAIGRPIANTVTYVLDAGGHQVPVGVIGELYIGGTGVARGYRGRPDLTGERFSEKPVAAGVRLYRTGDLARYDSEGTLFCLGRTDNDEKIRGFRIAVEEVEGALNSHPAIAAAAVRSWPDASGNRFLAAYLVGHDGEIPSASALREHLAKVLPDYMIPSRFEQLAELPMTPNRKVDRKALPEPGEGTARQDFVPPQGLAEELLAGIWREVLGVEAIGHSDSFFDLGGHSLLVTKLLRRVEASYGRKFSMADFFQSYRLDAMAARLEEGGEQAAAVPVINPRPADTTIPQSANQRQVWLHESMAPDALLYNESITIHRFGAFKIEAMVAAFNEILRRHESWRTGFEMIDGELIQTVHPWRAIDIPFSDVSNLPESDRNAAAEVIGSADARQAIDLARPPLFRAHIVRLAEDDHRLYLSLHHIIFDGLTLNRVILPELAALYEALAAGKPSPLPEPVLQYGDYAVWQGDHLESPAVQQQLDHWRQTLAGAPAKLALPGDRARPVERTHAGAMQVFTLRPELAEGLKALSRTEGVTLYMVLLAAFKAMLHRYSGEEDIVVGGVTDLRRRPEIEQLAGYFLNTIALRSKPSGAQPFRSYLAQVRDSVLGALGASEVPFDMIVRELKLRAEPGAHPLFDIFFSMQPLVDPFPAGWDLTHSEIAVGAAKFDLYLEVEDRPDGMIGRLPYSTEIFEPATIRRMIGHWLTILEHIVADPACRLSDLPLLTADEKEQMLIGWNDTARELPAESLPQMIASQAQKHPATIALVSGEQSWSYADLDREAGRIASRLHTAGVKPGSLVGVLMNRSPQTVAGLLAILRLGAAYVPLDPAFPPARLEHILADAAPDTLLTEPSLAGMLSPQNCRVVLAEGSADGEAPPIAAIDGDDLAYILYTSGSTGKPKGVEIPHRALVNLLLAMAHEPGFTADDSLLAVTTLSFDIAMLEIFLPLLRGGRLILASRDDAVDPERLAALITATRPSVMQATPATWRALLESGWSGDRKLKILCGGEALSRDLADQLVRRSGELWNMYGPTETTIWSTVQKVERGAGPVAIGRPIANTVTYVLDAGGQQVPVGVVGELHIGGAGVARGYRGRADLTAERFGEKPVAPGVRLYRTGDLARYDSDGTLFCLGRTDNDEKIRGFRIAVEEVEGALNSHPAIAAAAVRSWPDASGNRFLAAYLVGHDDEIPSVGALRDHLGKLLPDYMIPSRFEQLSELPMTPNRKVDRKALPEPGDAVATVEFIPPETEAEKRLAAIWREVLRVETIGRHDSFFDLGGHSLLVAKLLRRVEQDYGRKFSMAAFFQSYRLAAMAAQLELGGEQLAVATVIPPRSPEAVIPLSSNQRQLWLHALMAPDALLYNESVVIHRAGAFDISAMERAFNELLRRHESWRTGFEMIDGELTQRVHPHRPIAIPLDDVGHLPEAERDAAADAFGSADADKPFDLAEAPLLRAHIVRLAEDDHRLYVALHHIIFDGVSIYRVILPELAALYDAFAAGRPSPLPEPVLQYGDYAVWQHDSSEAAPDAGGLDHWRGALADAPAKLELAGDRLRPIEPSRAGAMELCTLSSELTEKLKLLSRSNGATLYMTLLAAFKAMLHRYSGEEDIIVGGVTDMRRRPEQERLVGYLLDTVALRSRPSANLPFRSYLGDVRESVLGALSAGEVPFDLVMRELKIKAAPGTHPLFDIVFSMQPLSDPFPRGWDVNYLAAADNAAKFDLFFDVEERPGSLIGRLSYSSEIFEPSTIRRMLGHWQTVLEHIVVDPDCLLSDLSLLRPEEARLMLLDWNDTVRPLPPQSLPGAIAARAEAAPEATALVSGATVWSYADLDRETLRIASRLHAAGVKPGSLVGVLMNRSPQTVAGLLAILRLGAAYLPLDPGFPPARLEHIVADAAPDTLLTQPDLAGMLSLGSCRVVLAAGPADGTALPITTIDGDDLAYVLYTSGSTGKPKGVEVSHRALMNLLVSMSDEPGFGASNSLLAVTTLSFDIAALEIFLPLLCGGRLILASRDDAFDPERLAALITATKPSVMQATPATWRALLESGWSGDRNLRILCGGEALSRDLANQLIGRSGELWNMYGPTETTIWSTVQKVERGSGPVAIGRPIANTVTYVLDAGGQQVPIGVIAELYIGGAGVARGYRGRADLTAERFGEKPVASGVRLYRTGDLARYDSEGTLYCLGRTDNDEKIRGFRIAVEEVEGALTSHPAIAAAAVRSWPDESGNRFLAAYLVGHDDEIPPVGVLRDHLATILPEYMIPSRFEQLAELPMTPNRKVDRKALHEPGDAVVMADFVPPEGKSEERLAAIWREVLGVETIGRQDSFFDLGGHSLLVAKLLRRVETDYGRKFSMAAFFQSYRLAAMAARLEQGEPLNAPGAVAIQPLGARPPVLWLEGGPTFLPLARAIGLDQPFLGVSLDPMLEAAAERPDMRDCARAMVAIIRGIRPTGPYYIGGWCTAGVLAYEVAAQLRAAGEDVPLVLLAHATNPTEQGRIGTTKLAWSKLRYHLEQLRRQPAGKRWRYLRDRIQGVGAAIGWQTADLDETALALRAKLDRSLHDYRPPAYAGDVALFQPAERPDLLDSRPGWAPLVSGKFIAQEIAGTHSSMLLHPYVEPFAAAMRAELLRAQATPGALRKLLRAVG